MKGAAAPALVSSVAGRLAERVWSGELEPGQRLEPQRELAQSLAVSRPTLRAALRRLAKQGVVEVRRGRAGGTIVSSSFVPLEVLPDTGPLTPAEVGELLEARRVLETQVALMAARHATEDDFARLRALVARQREAPSDWRLNVRLDTSFHLALARAAHNAILNEFMKRLHLRLEAARVSLLRTPHDQALLADINERTLRAIERGDPPEIVQDMAEHLGWLERAWSREKLVPAATPPLVPSPPEGGEGRWSTPRPSAREASP